MKITFRSSFILAFTLTAPVATHAQTTVPNSFQAGTPARATEVNENFTVLQQAVQQLESTATVPGPVGPQGPAGPQGLTGATGATGPVAVIDPMQVQTRVSGTCAVGSFVSAVAEDGSVTCANGTDGSINTVYGDTALANNISGVANTAVGVGALQSNTTGRWNTAVGVDALGDNTDGNFNTATGVNALWRNTTGILNTATGMGALQTNTTGESNTATGSGALSGNTTGWNNTATGESALHANSTGGDNVATGRFALASNTTGISNTASGMSALSTNSTGIGNTATGHNALFANTTADGNTAHGAGALEINSTGIRNTASGGGALSQNTIGSQNIALGYEAGNALTTGDNNIAIGNVGVAADVNTMRVGTAGNQNRAFVAGIRGVTTGAADAVTVMIDSNGQLGTVSSSRRYKEEINDMGQASDRLLRLHPVTFQYKQVRDNGEQPLEYGLIAEEVAEVFPELVVYNAENQPETIKYRLLSSMLLNELQKQHAALGEQYRVNQEQEMLLSSLNGQVGEIADLKAQVEDLSRLVNQIVN